MDPVSAPRSGVRWRFVAILLAYACLGLYFLPYHRFEITPDATSYLTIAEKYAHGDFRDAINSYWSPLLSWLLVPVVAAGLPAMLGPKLLLLIVGVGTLAGMRRLSRVFAMPELAKAPGATRSN